MKCENYILEEVDKYSIISKTKANFYCVFVNVHSIISAEEAIEDLNLECTTDDLNAEKLIIELYDDLDEAQNRVMMFRGKWLEHFYVCCYKNGKYFSENT